MAINVIDKRTELVTLSGRQSGLEWKIKGSKVFDYRDTDYLCDVESVSAIDLKNELHFITFPHGKNEKIPFIESSKPYIVSAYVPEGYYYYSCCGAHETDPQYVAIRADEAGLNKAIKKLEEIGKNIIYGKELDILGFNAILQKSQKRETKEKIADFMKLSAAEQKKILKEIL